MHFAQQIKTGFGTMQAKGIIEQLRASFSGYRYNPYTTPLLAQASACAGSEKR